MKICRSKLAGGMAMFLALLLSTPDGGQAQTATYLDHDGLTRELRSIVNASDLATMESMGTTLGGRDIWMVTLGSRSGSALEERPGVLVVGNLEGDHIVGSHLALESLRYLIQNQGDEAVKKVLDNNVIYFFPRLNPDGAEAMFGRVKWDRTTNGLAYDGDNDGLMDEDGPDDLNGDGYITVMRVADGSGDFMIDPADPRLMKRADATKGETGSHTLYWEGTDEDGDGFINEDAPGGVDLNRNFQHAYPHWQSNAGPHMVSELESRALMDFTISHRNIGAILTFGETDNLVTPPNSRGELAGAKVLDLGTFADASLADVFSTGVFSAGGGGGGRGGGGRGGGGSGGVYLRGAQPGRDNDPSSGTRPATTVSSGDQVYFTYVSEAYKRITGIENVPVHRTAEGAFFQYGYFQYGVPSFSTLGWGIPAASSPPRSGQGPQTDSPQETPSGRGAIGRAGGPGGAPRGAGQATAGQGTPGADKALLSALEGMDIEAFADWASFQHPELGEVEIGGFLPYATQNPPIAQVAELGEKHGEFLAELAGMLPRVRIAETKVTAHGGGVFTVAVEVENTGFLPTSLQHGTRSRSVKSTFVQIQVDDDDILSGAGKTTNVEVLSGSGTRSETVTWVIQGREGASVEIKLQSQKAGRDTATITLR